MQILTPDVLCEMINRYVTADEPVPEPEPAPQVSPVDQVLIAFGELDEEQRRQFLLKLNGFLTQRR